MLTKRVIPCLDVHAGRVVKGTRFVDLRDAGDPVQVAARYQQEGADELVFLDISASHEERQVMVDVVRQTANEVFMPLTVGGGVRDLEDIRMLLLSGCDKVSLNTMACLRPAVIDEAAERFGSQCIVVNIDPKRTEPGSTIRWEVYSHGGRRPTGRDAVSWAQEMQNRGAGEIVLTSMDCDGTQAGYDLELTAAVSDAVQIPVVASGGAGCVAHLVDAVLRGHADAVLAASIFHFGLCSVGAAKQAMRAEGIAVRL